MNNSYRKTSNLSDRSLYNNHKILKNDVNSNTGNQNIIYKNGCYMNLKTWRIYTLSIVAILYILSQYFSLQDKTLYKIQSSQYNQRKLVEVDNVPVEDYYINMYDRLAKKYREEWEQEKAYRKMRDEGYDRFYKETIKEWSKILEEMDKVLEEVLNMDEGFDEDDANMLELEKLIKGRENNVTDISKDDQQLKMFYIGDSNDEDVSSDNVMQLKTDTIANTLGSGYKSNEGYSSLDLRDALDGDSSVGVNTDKNKFPDGISENDVADGKETTEEEDDRKDLRLEDALSDNDSDNDETSNMTKVAHDDNSENDDDSKTKGEEQTEEGEQTEKGEQTEEGEQIEEGEQTEEGDQAKKVEGTEETEESEGTRSGEDEIQDNPDNSQNDSQQSNDELNESEDKDDTTCCSCFNLRKSRSKKSRGERE